MPLQASRTGSSEQADSSLKSLRPPRSRQAKRQEEHFLPFSAPDLTDEELVELTGTLRSGWLSTGAKVRQFEDSFAKFLNVRHAVAVNNGTTAFRLVWQTIDLRPGDEVLMSPFAPVVAAELVRAVGAVPRFVDVTERGLHISPELLPSAIKENTRAILISHVAGLPAEMDELLTIARQHRLIIVEDAGHALPATYRHHMVGGIGDISCFTFFSQKGLSLGEGGMVCTNDTKLAELCRMNAMDPCSLVSSISPSEVGSGNGNALRPINQTAVDTVRISAPWRKGRLPQTVSDAQLLAQSADGYQASMNELAAGLGVAQLRRATSMWQRRREIALNYNVSFSRFGELQCPADREDSQHAWHLYLLRLNLQRLRITRNQFLDELRANGIGATVMPPPLHLHSAFSVSRGYESEDCPVATQEYAREVSLPIYSRMTDSDVSRVIEAVEVIIKHSRAIPNLPR